ncbi:tRNA pseudouridine(38-40) synthase TruA [Metaclostridioides mangenotii]|uniref:tRNA pseudouridine(38-40) synthase TruA n=1 Tax=Metaclostridioides mangenotii TaxID=1540 RepID=UPI0028E35371|nr:tRNA pseudouridine(38-40) synthase TruA [Clostridioides mangenotii]
MRNIKLVISYDGSRYKGFQKLADTDMTIQGKLETVLSKLTDENIELTASGRTDMGVHAICQVANFKTNSYESTNKIQKYLYMYLPEDIVINSVEEIDERFHSRYNVKSKTYVYKIDNNEYPSPFTRKYRAHVPKKLDVKKMKDASKYLIGEHDFSSFVSSKSKKKSNIRSIYAVEIASKDGNIDIYVRGNGFLHNMVRIIVGTLIDVGHGKIEPNQMQNLILAKNRSIASDTAPAKGLVLYDVKY